MYFEFLFTLLLSYEAIRYEEILWFWMCFCMYFSLNSFSKTILYLYWTLTSAPKLFYDCTIVNPFFLEGGESEDNEADNSKENNEGETVR